MELLSLGISPEQIAVTTFSLEGDDEEDIERKIKKLFEELFGIPYRQIEDADWATYVRQNYNYWIDFLGLVKGVDY